LTLLFSLIQAAACAEVGVTLISPFVGRITDYFKQKENKSSYPPSEDPGVISVRNIFSYYKHHGYKTVVMGASFRSKEQVIELAGCDFLTVSPALLEELHAANIPVPKKLDAANTTALAKVATDEKSFRWALNEVEIKQEAVINPGNRMKWQISN
jgi:transaldolase